MKKIISLLLCLCMVFGLVACGSSTSSSAAAPADNSGAASAGNASAPAAAPTQLNVATELTNTTMDPAAGSYNWFPLRWGVCETLFKFNDEMGVDPWLATKAEVAEDGLTWTITLRDDVVFSNGDPMTATSVVKSIERAYDFCDPDKGGNGQIQSFMTYESISADDASNTFTIVTNGPVIDLMGCLAYPWLAIVNVDASADIDVDNLGFITTAPYICTYNDPESNIQLKRNDNYWDGEVPYETVNIMKLGESSTRAMALQDGSADMAINISAADREALAAAGNYLIDVTGGNRIGMCFINHRGILGNETLRKAIAMAIDCETICKITVNGAYTYTNGSILPGYDAKSPYEYDPDKAMALLDEAGIVDGNGDGIRELDGKNIELVFIGSTSRQQDIVAQALVAQMEEIGLKVNLSFPESVTDIRNNLAYDIMYNNEVTMHTGDPGNFMKRWYKDHDSNSSNYSDYHSDLYDAVYSKLEGEFDSTARRAIFKELAQILADDVGAIPYGSYSFNICAASSVEGVHSYTCDYYWVTKDIKPAA